MDQDNRLSSLEKFLIIFPLTYLLGIDRFAKKEIANGFVKLFLTLFLVTLGLWIFELIKMSKNKFEYDLRKYFQEDLNLIQIMLILCPLTAAFGIDRLIYGYKIAGIIRFLFALILVGFLFWFVDLYKLFTKQYDKEVII